MTYTLDIDLKNKEAKKLVEFLKSLNYLKIEETKDENFEVPDFHKKIVLNRIKTAKRENFTSWSDLKKQIKHS